jgi:hypothetical protein
MSKMFIGRGRGSSEIKEDSRRMELPQYQILGCCPGYLWEAFKLGMIMQAPGLS